MTEGAHSGPAVSPPVLRGKSGVEVVLASASEARRTILSRAAVAFVRDAARIDESEIKPSLKAEGASAMQAAETLAELKARHVSRRHDGALVIGADQLLECGGIWFEKPRDMDEAAAHLQALAGKRHILETAVCVLRDGTRLWHHNARAVLHMRPFSDDFIRSYLAAAGESVLNSVGAYRLEGPGAQLFQHIEGDYFTILGLPLLPLLAFLRAHEVVPE